MYDLLISLLVFELIFGGALAGMVVRPLLSEHHQTPDSREIVKMATGLIGTLTALVLGLLIASAKSLFDQKTNQVRQMTATVILLDELLMQYGPEATLAKNARRGPSATAISPISLEAVRRIDQLFGIEREINGLSAGERLRIRQERSAPLLSDLEALLRTERAQLSRSSNVIKPINYMLNRWDGFALSMTEGFS